MRHHITLLLIIMTMACFGQEKLVSNIAEFNQAMKMATPGSVITLKNGEWKDVHFKVHGIGKKDNRIIVKAETNGKVIVTGDSKMDIYGKYLTVDGLWFKDGSPTSKSVVSFRKNSKEFAFNCRLTNTTISYYNPSSRSLNTHWVDLWGKNNRVDHNNFTGKTNDGTTLVVWLKGDIHTENNHQIDHNYFGKRPELGKNGGETIRIGTSANSMKSSKTIVENNIFRNCDGEIEIISNKSGDNIYRNNLFLASKGTLTLRHGNNALVEGNVFLGNNVPKTGGIRVINEGHIIRNNYLVGLQGNGFRGPIVIMNGVPNSPLNRYNQVKNVDIQHNTIINCGPMEFGAGKDAERSLPPINTLFANNLISNTNSGKILNTYDNIKGISFTNNIVNSDASFDLKLFKKAAINWKLLRSFPMPAKENTTLISNFKNDNSPKNDIVNLKREPIIVGAFNLNNSQYPEALRVKRGPNWKPRIVPPKIIPVKETITVEPGIGTLSKALKKANSGDILILKSGVYFVNKTQKINGNILIKGNGESIIKGSDDLPKALNYFFRVNEKSKLTLNNLIIDGENDTRVKYAVVSPDKGNAEKYSLTILNSTFKNFTNEKGGSIFKAYIGTMADTIRIENSKFLNSYRGLNLSYEKNNFGKYNAEVITIHNSVFKNITQFAINYHKTGVIPTGGGKLIITNSIFSKVANYEKGVVVKTKGIFEVEIKNSVFEGSYKVKNPVRLFGSMNIIENCLIKDNGYIKISSGAIKKNIYYKNPKWADNKNFIPSKKSILLKENNKVATIGLIKK
ncbi:MAG: polysaccharide lyase 6 family protein [Flavobacteriaceae bacterium]